MLEYIFEKTKQGFENLFSLIKSGMRSIKASIAKNFANATTYFGSFFSSDTETDDVDSYADAPLTTGAAADNEQEITNAHENQATPEQQQKLEEMTKLINELRRSASQTLEAASKNSASQTLEAASKNTETEEKDLQAAIEASIADTNLAEDKEEFKDAVEEQNPEEGLAEGEEQKQEEAQSTENRKSPSPSPSPLM